MIGLQEYYTVNKALKEYMILHQLSWHGHICLTFRVRHLVDNKRTGLLQFKDCSLK